MKEIHSSWRDLRELRSIRERWGGGGEKEIRILKKSHKAMIIMKINRAAAKRELYIQSILG